MVTRHFADIRAASQASLRCVSPRDGVIAGRHGRHNAADFFGDTGTADGRCSAGAGTQHLVPTSNERTNVPFLVEGLERLHIECDWESCSSTTTRPTAPPPPRERSAKATAASSAFAQR